MRIDTHFSLRGEKKRGCLMDNDDELGGETWWATFPPGLLLLIPCLFWNLGKEERGRS